MATAPERIITTVPTVQKTSSLLGGGDAGAQGSPVEGELMWKS
jgi:hypothetical protein